MQKTVEHERAVPAELPEQLALAALPRPAVAPQVLQVGLPHVAGAHPFGARRLRERAGEVGLARAGRALHHDVGSALDEAAGGELGDLQPVQPALLREADRPHVRLRVPQPGPLREVADLLADERRVRLAGRHLDPLREGQPRAHVVVLGPERLDEVVGARLAQLARRLRVDEHHRSQRPPLPEAGGQPRLRVQGGRGRAAQAAARRPLRRRRMGVQPLGQPRLPRRLRQEPLHRPVPLRGPQGRPQGRRVDAVNLPRRRAHRHAQAATLLRAQRLLDRRVPHARRVPQAGMGRRGHQGLGEARGAQLRGGDGAHLRPREVHGAGLYPGALRAEPVE